MSDVLVAIDGNSLMHRAYWAIRNPMTDAQGQQVQAVYGFYRMMFRLVREYDPGYLAVAFDLHGPTFRHDVYNDYKGQRQKTPDDLNMQFTLLKESLPLMGVRYLERERYEADDILGTLSVLSPGPNYIVTGDKDQLQLISPTTTVLMTQRGVSDVQPMNEETLFEKYGLRPEQIPDLKGLMGDASDNLPGVAGVGEKTALKLLHEFGTVRNLYEHIDDLPKNKLREKLIAGRDNAFMSKDLAVIDTRVDLGVSMDELCFRGFSRQGGLEVIKRFGFRSLAGEFDAKAEDLAATTERIPEAPAAEEIRAADLPHFAGRSLAAYLDDEVLHIWTDERELFLNAGAPDTEERRAVGEFLRKAAHGRQFIGFDVKNMLHAFCLQPDAFPVCQDVKLACWVLDPSAGDYRIQSVLRREQLPVCARSLHVLWDRQRKAIIETNLSEIYDNIEMPLVPVLYRMEMNGVRVDAAALDQLGEKYEEQMQQLTEQIYACAGSEFNLGSPKQLSDVLFVTLGLPPGRKTRTGYSTDITVLEKLKDEHPIVPLLIDYRAVAKLKQTYVDGLTAAIRDGYIHTTFLQTATATGRLSSTDPNLQNIPIHSQMADDIRRAFLAPDNCLIVSADYSQIELRILADIANDVQLREAFARGEDIHARTAAEILGKELADVTKEERSHAKAVNFGIVYGISDFGLARNTGLSRKAARSYIDRYLRRFPGVEQYMQDIKNSAKENGYVRTLYGRIRYIPDISSRNANVRAAGERAALNTPIQGTAADVMKLAMIRAQKKLDQMGAKLVLQVHDELIAYAKMNDADRVAQALRESMEGAGEFAVPLKVNTAKGRTWLEAK